MHRGKFVIGCSGLIASLSFLLAGAVHAETVLRIALPSTDVPTTTGMPNDGFEGMSYLGYPIFESLIFWDLTGKDAAPTLKPSLATEWQSDPGDRRRWIFKLRQGVKFHDGSGFDADAAIWTLERFYNDKAPQYDANGGGIARGRVPQIASWEKIDASTIAIRTKEPIAYFPDIVPYILFASPTAYAKAGSWAAFARAPAGTGPFRLERLNGSASVELAKNEAYWDDARKAKVDRLIIYAMAEGNTRVAALRSGQVDVIVAPPSDSVESLMRAGFNVKLRPTPAVWPYEVMTAGSSPFKDMRVRQAANYAVDREGIVRLLANTVDPASSYWPASRSHGAKPINSYIYDPKKSLQLLKEAGVPVPVKVKIMISTAGSGQLMSQSMNELLQESMREAGFDVSFQLVDYNQMLATSRQPVGAAANKDLDAVNIARVTGGLSDLYRWFPSSAAPPNGSNWGAWKNEEMDGLLKEISEDFSGSSDGKLKRVAEILTDDPPWVYVAQLKEQLAFKKSVTIPDMADWYIIEPSRFSKAP
jgi:peptide/nickel transport system substrate-binding protein